MKGLQHTNEFKTTIGKMTEQEQVNLTCIYMENKHETLIDKGKGNEHVSLHLSELKKK